MQAVTCIFMLAYASLHSINCEASEASLATRQAIPVALVQSEALTGHTIMNKSRADNDNNRSCNKTLQYCDPYITKQAKLEQEMRNMPSNFNITESSYNASLVHALHINKTMVTRNKTIILLQNQGEGKKKPKPPIDDYQTWKDLTNITIPVNKSVVNRTITIHPNRSITTNITKIKVEDVQTLKYLMNLSIPLNQTGKIYIPSSGNLSVYKSESQIIMNSKSPYLSDIHDQNVTNRNVSRINNENNENLKGPFSHTAYNDRIGVPSFQSYQTYKLHEQVDDSNKKPLVTATGLNQQPNSTNPVNQTASVRGIDIPSYNNSLESNNVHNQTDMNNTVPQANVENLKELTNSSNPFNRTSGSQTTSNNTSSIQYYKTYIIRKQPDTNSNASHTKAENIKEQSNSSLVFNRTIENGSMHIPSKQNPNNASRRSISNKKNDISYEIALKSGVSHADYKEIAESETKKIRTDKHGKIINHAVKRRKKSKQRLSQLQSRHLNSWRTFGNIINTVSVDNSLTPHSYDRKARYAFDYDSDNDYSTDLPLALPVTNYVTSQSILPVKYESGEADPLPVEKGRSDIWQPDKDDEARSAFESTIGYKLPTDNTKDTVADPRGHIELPYDDPAYSRSLRRPIGDTLSPQQIMEHVLTGKLSNNPDHAMEKEFYSVDGPMKSILKNTFSNILDDGKKHYGPLRPKDEMLLRENDKGRYQNIHDDNVERFDRINPKTTISNHDDPRRIEEEKLQDDELGMMLDKFDRETRRIAKLYKYLGPRNERTYAQENENPSAYNVPQRYQHYEEHQEKIEDVGRNKLNYPQTNERRYLPDTGFNVYHPYPVTRSYSLERSLLDELKQRQDNLRSNTELNEREAINLHTEPRVNNDPSRGMLITKPPQINNVLVGDRRNMVENSMLPEQYNRAQIMKELVNYITSKQRYPEQGSYPRTPDTFNREMYNSMRSPNYPSYRPFYNGRPQENFMPDPDTNRNLIPITSVSNLLNLYNAPLSNPSQTKLLFPQVSDSSQQGSSSVTFKGNSNPNFQESTNPTFQESANSALHESPYPAFPESVNSGLHESPNPTLQESANTALHESPNPTFQESSNPGLHESPVKAFQEFSNSGLHESPIKAFQEFSNSGLRESPNTAIHVPSNSGLPESPNTAFHESSNSGLPVSPNIALQDSSNTVLNVSPKMALQESLNSGLHESPNTAFRLSLNPGLHESPNTALQESSNSGLHESPSTVLQESSNSGLHESPSTVLQESSNSGLHESPNIAFQESSNSGLHESPNIAFQESSNSALEDASYNTQHASSNSITDFPFKDKFYPPPAPAEQFASKKEFPEPRVVDGGKELAELLSRNNIANKKGMVMLIITTPTSSTDDETVGRKETVDHRELTQDGFKRVNSNNKIDDGKNGDESKNKDEDDDTDFSKNLKAATDFVLGDAVKAGNITKEQRDDIEEKLTKILDSQDKNKTKLSEDKLDQYISTKDKNISASSLKILHEITGEKKSVTPKMEKKLILRLLEVPLDPVMYLTFDTVDNKDIVLDASGNHNDAKFENNAGLSSRVLGTCGKAADLNDGSVTWSGRRFKRKPTKAVTIAMWVKVKRSGVINWFANGRKGHKIFYTKSNGTAIPAKVWTHTAGTFDSRSGLARIYINGDLEQETMQPGGKDLPQNWLVNGIGSQFGDDSMQYVDELVVYDRALNVSEIRTLANRCVFNRMILHYGFQNGNKTNINDQSGLENNGILTGGAILKLDCNRCGSCLDLQAGPDPSLKIQQVSIKNLPRVKVSIAVWISLNDTKGVHNIFKTESSKGNIGYHLQVKNGRIRWYIASDKGHTIFDNTTKNEVVPEALWTHVIVSYNNENGKVAIYSNSLLKFKDTVPDSKRKYLPVNWDNDASIGDSSFHGYLDEFIMYNWELDSSESLYVRNYCADHPKLVRFTVRVPLTKKTVVPARPKPIQPHPTWYYLYKKLLARRNAIYKRTLSQMRELEKDPNSAYPLLK